MRPALLLLALPYLCVATLLLVWICKRLPAGWRRVVNGITAACVLYPLAYYAWEETIAQFTRATYVCVECGRSEAQRHFQSWTYSHKLLDNGAEYCSRFPAAARAHRHDWHLESCLFSETGSVACTMECIEGWFHVLPMLKDREAADQLVEKARALPRDERCRLMDELSYVWYEVREGKDADAAFANWRVEQRRK